MAATTEFQNSVLLCVNVYKGICHQIQQIMATGDISRKPLLSGKETSNF